MNAHRPDGKWLLTGLGLAAAACAPPPASLVVRGQALDADGGPWRDRVSLYTVSSELVDGKCVEAALAYASLTLLGSAQVDGEGRYQFDVPTAQSGSCLQVQLADAAATGDLDESYNQVVFPAEAGADVPPLRPWRGMVAASMSVNGVVVEWRHPDWLADLSYVVWFRDLGSGWMVWQAVAGPNATRIEVPSPLLEDFQVGAAVIASSEVAKDGFGYTFVHASGSSSVFDAGAVPPSRGASCFGGDGAPIGARCPFTDGSSVGVELGRSSVTFELASPLAPRRAVLRGLQVTERAVIEASLDGTTFATIGELTAHAGPELIGRRALEPRHGLYDVALEATAPARVFRLRAAASSGEASIATLGELSLFP